jgi:hypothetical protein
VLLLMGPLGYSLRSPLRGRSSSVLRAFRLSCLRRNDEPKIGCSRQPRLAALQVRPGMYPLPCLQGRGGVGWLFSFATNDSTALVDSTRRLG